MTNFYDRSQFGYNANNLRSGAREIKNLVGKKYEDFTTTMGNRFEAYQNEQSQAAGNNPLAHVGVVPAVAGTYAGVRLLGMANDRQTRLDADAGFKRQLTEGGVDPARHKELMKLRDEVFKPGVDPHLHQIALQQKGYSPADIDLVRNIKTEAEAVTTLGDKMKGSGGRGLKFVQSLDPQSQKILEGYVNGVAKGSPTAEGFAQHVQRLQASGKIPADKLRAFGSVAAKMSTENPAHIFDTVKTLGAYGGTTAMPASQSFARGVELTRKLNMQYKPSIWAKLLGGAAKLFKRSSITDEMVKQALEAQPLFGHAMSNMMERTTNAAQERALPQHARDTKQRNAASTAAFAKKLDEFEASKGKLDYNNPESLSKLNDFMGYSVRSPEKVEYMDKRYGVPELGRAPNAGRMTDEQIAQYQAAASKKGVKTSVDELSWNPAYSAYTTSMTDRSKKGVGFDPKTGGMMELTPLEIANKQFMKDRPQATIGREGTLKDAFNPREMGRDAINYGRRSIEGAAAGAIGGVRAGGLGGIAPGAIWGLGAGGAVAAGENIRTANNYDVERGVAQRKSIPGVSTLFDFGKYISPVSGLAGDAAHTATNLADHAAYGNADGQRESTGEEIYKAVKPHAVRAFGSPRNEVAR